MLFTETITTTEGALTKREIFILAAMQGFCANPEYAKDACYYVSDLAISQADNLLEKLEKESNQK